jgi:hypothetical protein
LAEWYMLYIVQFSVVLQFLRSYLEGQEDVSEVFNFKKPCL